MSALAPAFIANERSITLVLGTTPYTIPDTHPNWTHIREALKTEDWDVLPTLVDIPAAVEKFGEGVVTVKDGLVFYKGQEMHNVVATRIIAMLREGFNVTPLIKFLENLMQNPSKTAVQELYLFMEAGQLPLTPDGHFLAYKRVGPDYKDLYSHSLDYSVGKTVSMPRNEVDDVRDRVCSYGIHFCSKEYLPHYGADASAGNKVVIVKINPRDVVSIPSDYSNTKGRVCELFVAAELDVSLFPKDMERAVYEAPDVEYDDEEEEYNDPDFDDYI